MTHAPLTQNEIVQTAKLIEATRGHGTKVTWAVWGPGEDPAKADVAHLLTGLPRYIERTNQATGEVAASEDIRDQFLRITTTFEHWLKVSDVLRAIEAGVFIFERKAAAAQV